jgi:hypothetical protein
MHKIPAPVCNWKESECAVQAGQTEKGQQSCGLYSLIYLKFHSFL